MENIHSTLQRYESPVKRAGTIWPVLLVGLGLGAVLGGLAGLNPLLGVAGDLLLLLAIIVVPRPIFVVYGLTFLLPLTAGMDRGGVIPFLRVGQALLVVSFLLFLLARPGRQGKSRITSIDLAFVLFFLAGDVFPVLALLYRGEPLNLNTPDRFTGVTPIQVLLGPLQYYLLYRIVVAIISSERQIAWVLKLSFVTSMIVSVIGILQKVGIGVVTTFLTTYYPTTNLHDVFSPQPLSLTDLRITSTLETYSGLAAYLACNVIAALACYSASRKPIISPLLLAATLFIDSAALVLTGTFVAWVGVVIGAMTVFIVFRRVPRSLVFVVVGMLLTVFIFSSFLSSRFSEWLTGANSQGFIPQTYAYRIVLWKDLILPAIGQHLLFGAGPAPKSSAYWPSEETQYLSLLLRGGLLYFFSYCLLMGVAIAACWRRIKQKSGGASHIVATATLAILVVINVMNVSGEYFTYAGVTQILWTLLAMVVASAQLSLADHGRRNSNGCSISVR